MGTGANPSSTLTFSHSGGNTGAANYAFMNGNVGIGTATPTQKLDLVGSMTLENTTTSSTGVIYKGSNSFIHNFQHPIGGTAIPSGRNTFVGIGSGNFTIGSTAATVDEGSYNTALGVIVDS